MDWSSFFPDSIVGIGTGFIVAGAVLLAERIMSARARRLTITNAQGASVERARTLLQHEIRFRSAGIATLHPDMAQLDRLREVIKDVPVGIPLEHIVGFHWAERVVARVDEVESLADAISARIADHDRAAGPTAFLGNWLHKNVNEIAERVPDAPDDWEWRWWEDESTKATDLVEADAELRFLIDQYVRQRRLLHAYRKAFLTADELWRSDAWVASLAAGKGAPHNFVKGWWRERRRRRTVADAAQRAEATARDLITEVDPMAY